MATIIKPQYDIKPTVYTGTPVQTSTNQAQDTSNVDTSEAKVWDSVVNGLGVFAELFEKSSITSDKIQARSLIADKVKNAQFLSQQLNLHLADSDPEDIKLGNVVSKVQNGEFFIGKDKNIAINPLKIPDETNDNVRSMVASEYMRIDGGLMNQLLGLVDEAQTIQDTKVLAGEVANMSVLFNQIFNDANPENDDMNEGKVTQVLQAGFLALDDREGNGTFTRYEIEEGKRSLVKHALRLKYLHDKNQDRDGTIKKANLQEYKWSGRLDVRGKNPEDTSVTIHLEPNVYENDETSLANRGIAESYKVKEEDKLLKQNLFLARRDLAITDVTGASLFVTEFGISENIPSEGGPDRNSVYRLNRDAINKDEAWINAFPNETRREIAATKLLMNAQKITDRDHKAQLSEIKKGIIIPSQFDSIMRNTASQYMGNIGKENSIVNPDPFGGKNPTTKQRNEYNALVNRLKTITGFANGIKGRTPNEIVLDIDNIKKLNKIDLYTNNISTKVLDIAQKRHQRMIDTPLDIAFEEMDQIGKEDIDWIKIDKWYESHGLLRNGQLVPKSINKAFVKEINNAKNYIDLQNIIGMIKGQYNSDNEDKALYEIQSNLPPAKSAFLDIDLDTIDDKAPLWEYLNATDKPDNAGFVEGDSANTDRYILNALNNSFPAQFESHVRRNKHAQLIREYLSWEVGNSSKEYTDDTVKRVVSDLYGNYTVADMGADAKVVFSNKDLAPYRVNASMMKNSKTWAIKQKSNLGQKISIRGLNEFSDKSLLEVAKKVMAGDGNMDFAVINSSDGGTRVVLVHWKDGGRKEIGRIVANVTANDKVITYSKEHSIKNFVSESVGQYADANDDSWDNINFWLVGRGDQDIEKFRGYYKNRVQLSKKQKHAIGANVLDGSLTREASQQPGKRELDFFVIPLMEKIEAFELENNRAVTQPEWEQMYAKQKEKLFGFQDGVSTTVMDMLNSYVNSFGTNR
jgi:hypothetical protein